jgi:hypothetical protein
VAQAVLKENKVTGVSAFIGKGGLGGAGDGPEEMKYRNGVL